MKKIQIQFSGLQVDSVESMKAASGRKTWAEVIRDAIQFYDWCRRQIAEGFVIVAIKKDHTRELILPFEKE